MMFCITNPKNIEAIKRQMDKLYKYMEEHK